MLLKEKYHLEILLIFNHCTNVPQARKSKAMGVSMRSSGGQWQLGYWLSLYYIKQRKRILTQSEFCLRTQEEAWRTGWLIVAT